MEYTVGAVVEGKVTGITKFGAFVSLPGNKTGMVHISEIAHAYVSDINEFLTIGQEVKAMIIAVDDAGKINLSIKRTIEAPARANRSERTNRGERQGGYQSRGDRNGNQSRNDGQSRGYQSRGDRNGQYDRSSQNGQNTQSKGGERQTRSDSGSRGRGGFQRSSASKEPQSFDDMLKQFMADSDSNISSNKMYADHRTKRKRQS